MVVAKPGCPVVGLREAALWLLEVRVGLAPSRLLPDELARTDRLHPPQLEVLLAGVDHDRDSRIALQVDPALAPDDRIEPQSAPVPAVPEGADVGPAVGASGAHPADQQPCQVRIPLLVAHGDFATA